MGQKRKKGFQSDEYGDVRKQAPLTRFFSSLSTSASSSTTSSSSGSESGSSTSTARTSSSGLDSVSSTSATESSESRNAPSVEQYSQFRFPKFASHVNHVLTGLITIAMLDAVHMKSNVKAYLRNSDQWELLALILSFVPTVVQSALDTENWSWRDLIGSAASHLTGRKGIYFGIAQPKTKLLDIVGYVGTGIGRGGLIGRIKNHLSSKFRQGDLPGSNPKHLYKYVEGLLDEPPSLSFTALAYFRFMPDQTKELRTVLSDIVEATMVILLGTLQTGEGSSSNEYENAIYAKLRPEHFKCTETIIPSNRICPAQPFFVKRLALKPTERVPTKAEEKELPEEDAYEPENMEFDTVYFKKHPHRPGPMAYFKFSELLEIPLPLKVLQCLQIQEGDKISVRFDVWERGIPHPHRWLQEEIPGKESSEVLRLGIEVSGVTTSRAPFSFWLRRNSDGEDWSDRRTTSNHFGAATAISIMEALNDSRILPVPKNRRRLFAADDAANDEQAAISDLTTAKEYPNRVTYRARDYTAVLLENRLWMDSSFEEEYLKTVCYCNHKHYTCYVHQIGKECLEPCPWRYEERCWELFETSSYAFKHSHSHHRHRNPPKTILCEECGKTFERDPDLARHIKEMHSENAPGFKATEPTPRPLVSRSASDSAVFTDSAVMSGRWVDDGTVPPNSWNAIIGMILLDDLRAGNYAGLSVYEIRDRIPGMFRYYTLNDEIKKSGWPMSVIRAIRGATKLFIKRGKPENDRSLEKKAGQDRWIIKPGQEDQFKNPRRNLTKRSGAGGDKSMKPKDDDLEG